LRRGDAQKNAPKTHFDDRSNHEATAIGHLRAAIVKSGYAGSTLPLELALYCFVIEQ
jgi:hypothetical protein